MQKVVKRPQYFMALEIPELSELYKESYLRKITTETSSSFLKSWQTLYIKWQSKGKLFHNWTKRRKLASLFHQHVDLRIRSTTYKELLHVNCMKKSCKLASIFHRHVDLRIGSTTCKEVLHVDCKKKVANWLHNLISMLISELAQLRAKKFCTWISWKKVTNWHQYFMSMLM